MRPRLKSMRTNGDFKIAFTYEADLWVVNAQGGTATRLTTYPGTESFNRLEKEGRILTRNWEKYDSLNVVFQPLKMSPEELRQGMRRVWKEVFSFPSICKRVLKRPWIHPLFYLGLNWQFHRLTKNW